MDPVTKNKPSLLFLSPALPRLTGNGLAMRAGALLEALSQDCEVHLLVIPISSPINETMAPELQARCASFKAHPPGGSVQLLRRALHHPLLRPAAALLNIPPVEWKYTSPGFIRRVHEHFTPARFDIIHVFRLCTYPFAEPFIRTNPEALVFLDLDDIDSQARETMTRHATGLQRLRLKQDAAFYRRQEDQVLPGCDGVYLCSYKDRTQLANRCGIQHLHAVPNTVRKPAGFQPTPHDPFTFLFVGNMNYLPNLDALDYFTRDILPGLRDAAPRSFRITIAGGGEEQHLRRFRTIPEYEVLGVVPELAPIYAASDATIVPLRMGGGTRIKILESFGYKVPVISTPCGAEGLEVAHGKDLLLAEAPEAFIQACLELMKSPERGRNLAEQASETLTARYEQSILPPLLQEIISRTQKH